MFAMIDYRAILLVFAAMLVAALVFPAAAFAGSRKARSFGWGAVAFFLGLLGGVLLALGLGWLLSLLGESVVMLAVVAGWVGSFVIARKVATAGGRRAWR